MAVAVLNAQRVKTYRFWVRQLLRRRDQLNAYDDATVWRNWEQHRLSAGFRLHKNISRRFWLSVGLALGNCQTSNILVYHGSESPFNHTSS